MGRYWLAFAAVLTVLGLVLALATTREQVFQETYQFQPLPNQDGTQTAFSQPFKLKGRKNIVIEGDSNVDNTWIYFEGDLINEDTGLVQPFSVSVEYYRGVEDGEAWSEGGQSTKVYLSALPAGNYTLRLEGQWEHWEQPSPSLTVKIEQGVSRGIYWPIAMFAISIVPLFAFIRRRAFEARRWKDSMYS
jgi:hypothetical protein